MSCPLLIMIKKEIVAYVNIYKCMFYACSLCITFQALVPTEMSFEKFTQLTLLQKEQKLIFAFKKIATRAERDRNI